MFIIITMCREKHAESLKNFFKGTMFRLDSHIDYRVDITCNGDNQRGDCLRVRLLEVDCFEPRWEVIGFCYYGFYYKYHKGAIYIKADDFINKYITKPESPAEPEVAKYKVGDRYALKYGEPVEISSIDMSHPQPIEIKYSTGYCSRRTLEGKYEGDCHASKLLDIGEKVNGDP